MKADFTTRPRTRQSGYALILMVLALMGLGGVVIAGFTQGAKQQSEHERYLHNQRVLQEAKQALLQYAYNYPQMGPGQNDGPGRLLCPDTANDGLEVYTPNCSSDLIGRFPWKEADLDFYEALDASGERLWYAVSENFGRGPGLQINSSSYGSITVKDRSGAVLHDGSDTTAGSGVVAVIIAPGAPLARNGVMQVRGTDEEKKDATNYLDLFGAVDNAEFVNDDPDNGFVTGPIRDVVSGDLLVNDQMIIVTAAEVIAMAEMATLQAYRSAINDYLVKTSGVYPWLYNYEGIEYDMATQPVSVAIDKLSEYFPAYADFTDEDDYLGFDSSGGNDGIFGRIPSMFGGYFTEVSNPPFSGSRTIESRLVNGSLSLIDPAATDTYTLTETYCKDGCPGESADVVTFKPDLIDGGPTLQFETTQVLTGVQFIDKADVVGEDGRFSVTFPVAESIGPFEVYFWDGDNDPSGTWTACPAGADELIDCSRDSSGNPTPGMTNNYKSRILHMTLTLNFSDVENFDFDYEPGDPVISVTAADGTSHATISATYAADNIISFPGTLSGTYEYERHWHDGDSALDPDNNTYARGNVNMTGFTLGSLTLGIRYFPEVPLWTYSNGWHNAIRMAYALEYKPPGVGPCIVDSTCLQLDDSPGAPRNVAALLVIAGQHDWDDDDSPDPPNGRLKNNLLTVFDPGNENNNPTFYRHRGNDKILVIDEL